MAPEPPPTNESEQSLTHSAGAQAAPYALPEGISHIQRELTTDPNHTIHTSPAINKPSTNLQHTRHQSSANRNFTPDLTGGWLP